MWNSEYESNYLSHHGILGQKWGVRRFQNPDGSLTNAGKVRYDGSSGDVKRYAKEKGMDTSKLGGFRKAVKEYRKDYGEKKIEDARKAKDNAKTRLGKYIANNEEVSRINKYKLSGSQRVKASLKSGLADMSITAVGTAASLGAAYLAKNSDQKWLYTASSALSVGSLALGSAVGSKIRESNIRKYAEKNRSKS